MIKGVLTTLYIYFHCREILKEGLLKPSKRAEASCYSLQSASVLQKEVYGEAGNHMVIYSVIYRIRYRVVTKCCDTNKSGALSIVVRILEDYNVLISRRKLLVSTLIDSLSVMVGPQRTLNVDLSDF